MSVVSKMEIKKIQFGFTEGRSNFFLKMKINKICYKNLFEAQEGA